MDSRTALLNAPRRYRQAVAMTLPLLAASLVGAIAFGLYGAHRDAAASLQERRIHLGRLQTAVSAAGTMSPSGAEVAAGEEIEFLGQNSEAYVQAWFQQRLSQIARSHGMTILSAANTPIVDRDGFSRAGLRASLAGSNDASMAALGEIETSSPYLIVRSARISLQKSGERPDGLLLEVQLEGLMPPLSDPPSGTEGGDR